jgi:hypothetical protein
MVTVRCTQKLLRRLPPPENAPASTTILGDWYANIWFSRPQLIVCVSERSLLPVVLPAKGLATLVPRLAAAAGEVLLRLGVAPHLVHAEQAAMQTFSYARTQNRSVLGSLNDFIFLLSHYVAGNPAASLLEHSLHLAHTPCAPIGPGFPDKVTRELFQAQACVAKTH